MHIMYIYSHACIYKFIYFTHMGFYNHMHLCTQLCIMKEILYAFINTCIDYWLVYSCSWEIKSNIIYNSFITVYTKAYRNSFIMHVYVCMYIYNLVHFYIPVDTKLFIMHAWFYIYIYIYNHMHLYKCVYY